MGRAGFENRTYSDKKIKYHKTMNRLLDEYKKIVVVGVDNVQSAQLQAIRMQLRGTAEMLLGKNTMMKKVLTNRRDAEDATDRDKHLWEKFVAEGLLKLNVGLIFTNAELTKVKEVIDNNLIQAPARQGSVAPVDVVVPAGNTGLEPTKTSFFQALNIGTKITKGTVEILKDVQVVTEGDKVGSSEATLLQMLKIKPFHYGLEILTIYDEGNVYGAWVLSITDELMMEKCSGAINNVTCLSLGLGIPTILSAPHTVMNAFKNCMGLALSEPFADYEVSGLGSAEFKEAVLNGPSPDALAAAAAASSSSAAAAAEAPAEDEDDEDDAMGFGLFD